MKEGREGSKLVVVMEGKGIGEWFKEELEKLREKIGGGIEGERKGKGLKV